MSASKLETLHQRMKAGMIENFEGKSFLLDSVLFQILHDTDLDACLREAGVTLASLPDKDRERIRKGGQKLFALLALLKTKSVELIVNFIKADQLLDASLDAFLPCKRIDDISDILENNLLATEFFDTQWSLTAPLFYEDGSHRDLRKQTILPFIVRTTIGRGGYSQVYKVTLDSRHHCLGRGPGVPKDELSIACKVMYLDSLNSTFENEKDVLQFLRQIRHRNMVQLLSSFSIELHKLGSVKHLLFPLAERSLQELLERDARYSGDIIRLLDTDETVFSELFGLASALENLHTYVNIADGIRLKGIHFDLAPRNFLIYQGKLLLADFGLSRLRNETSNSYTPFKGGVGHYLAPECIDKDFAPLNKHGSKSDIWSLAQY
ncbi:kinase-like protein [Stipitochalara longipes BDJ]|nr:kinase-like protein [Stipitochalara longipes BDJ]